MNENDRQDSDEFADSWLSWAYGFRPGTAIPLSELNALQSYTSAQERTFPFYTPLEMMGYDRAYRKAGSGKTSLSKLLAALQGFSPQNLNTSSGWLSRRPFQGLNQPTLTEAAVMGVSFNEKTAQVNRYLPDHADRCIQCFRRDIFECTCGNYMSQREFSTRGRISVFDSFDTQRVFFDYLRMNGGA